LAKQSLMRLKKVQKMGRLIFPHPPNHSPITLPLKHYSMPFNATTRPFDATIKIATEI